MIRGIFVWSRMLVLLSALLQVSSSFAQTNSSAPAGTKPLQKDEALLDLKESVRNRCLEGRRSICGRILRIFPDGILVEAGYTNLLRKPLTKSWLVPAIVVASPAPNLVESQEPGAICVGTVFLTDLPRGKPHRYDYVILCGYPTGEFTYISIGTIKKTVRRFSANLDKAVHTVIAGAEVHAASPRKE